MNNSCIYIAFITAISPALSLGQQLPENSSTTASNAITPTEVARKVVSAGDHKITYVRIRPPSLPQLPPPPEPRPPTAEEQAAAERIAAKPCATLNVSATVYLGGAQPVTELRWHDDTGALFFRAWSNVDFRHLTQLLQFETATTVYAWFPMVDEVALSDWPADQASPIPADLQFEPGVAEYYIESGVASLASEETTLAGLDYLHAFSQLHAAALKADYEHREADCAAREKELREHPPKTPDTVIQFWPVQSRLNPR
jgi:hypothetical protein